jgi:N-acetyl-anhydromuramyl-L-alanine amidase AmpD
MALDLNKIVQHKFSDKEYVKEVHEKKQIVLHHTVSGDKVTGDINWWLKDRIRVGTCVLIERDGTIHQVFSSKYWAYHLGENGKDHVKMALPYKRNDKNSIGIEIDSWGGLKKKDGKWYSSANTVIPDNKVQEYPEGYRGFYAFEKYTDKQIAAVKDLLVYWNKIYGIPLEYNEDMWDLSYDALAGKSGVYSHTSYRSDKSDCHPQPELIKMLKSL